MNDWNQGSMSFETIWFIRAALVYFGCGILLGLTMGIRPDWMYLIKPVHAHLNLLGFMSMFVYGVAYHVLPRFKGRPLFSQKLSRYHLYLANLALVGMAVSFPFYTLYGARGTVGLAVFGTLQAVAAGMFIFNIWKTLD